MLAEGGRQTVRRTQRAATAGGAAAVQRNDRRLDSAICRRCGHGYLPGHDPSRVTAHSVRAAMPCAHREEPPIRIRVLPIRMGTGSACPRQVCVVRDRAERAPAKRSAPPVSRADRPALRPGALMGTPTQFRWTFAATALAWFVFALDRLVVTTALPTIRTEFGGDLAGTEGSA